MKKIQVLFINGGMTFSSYENYLEYLKNKKISIDKKVKWNEDYLENSLGENFQVIKPRMPLQDNAKYKEWKIYFEKYFENLENDIILVGFSLGGTFLIKYLSENDFPKKISAIYLVAPPFDNSLEGEELVGGFELGEDLSKIMKTCKNVNLLFSKNDDCIPISYAEKYREKLPNATIITYGNKKGHFNVPEFPELIEMIKKDAGNSIRNP